MRLNALVLTTASLLTMAAFPFYSIGQESNTALANLAGRWEGEALMIFPKVSLPGDDADSGSDSGTTLEIPPMKGKCTSTYFVDGIRLHQVLKCVSASGMKIHIETDLKVDGGAIAGTWSEESYANSGSMTGELTAKGYDVRFISTPGDNKMDLSGKISVETDNQTSQEMTMTFDSESFPEIHISLKKLIPGSNVKVGQTP
jgi:hypothetical protein